MAKKLKNDVIKLSDAVSLTSNAETTNKSVCIDEADYRLACAGAEYLIGSVKNKLEKSKARINKLEKPKQADAIRKIVVDYLKKNGVKDCEGITDIMLDKIGSSSNSESKSSKKSSTFANDKLHAEIAVAERIVNGGQWRKVYIALMKKYSTKLRVAPQVRNGVVTDWAVWLDASL